MSISLIAVFIPILMMPGIIGRLFREFAIVLSVAIAVSLAISLTATPMMCSRLLKVKHTHGRLYNWSEKVFQWIISTYASALQAVLNHPAPVLLVMLLTVGISGYLYVKIPKGFFPQQDTGRLQGQVQGQQHISYQSLVEKAKWFEEQVRTDPDIDTVGVTAGSNGGGWGGAATAQIFVQLKAKRTTTPDQVIARIRNKTSGMPGATLYLQSQQDLRIGGRQSNAQYQYTLQTQDLDQLNLWAPRVLDKLVGIAGTGGCEFGPTEFGSVFERHHRPRYCVAPGSHRAGGGQCAL